MPQHAQLSTDDLLLTKHSEQFHESVFLFSSVVLAVVVVIDGVANEIVDNDAAPGRILPQHTHLSTDSLLLTKHPEQFQQSVFLLSSIVVFLLSSIVVAVIGAVPNETVDDGAAPGRKFPQQAQLSSDSLLLTKHSEQFQELVFLLSSIVVFLLSSIVVAIVVVVVIGAVPNEIVDDGTAPGRKLPQHAQLSTDNLLLTKHSEQFQQLMFFLVNTDVGAITVGVISMVDVDASFVF